MGFKIFAHAVRLVFNHLGEALRISGVLYLISSGFDIVLTPFQRGTPSPGLSILLFLSYLPSIFISIWIAVAWHRYILLDELPDTMIPRFDGRRALIYFRDTWRVALAGVAAVLLVLLVALGVSFVLGIILTVAGAGDAARQISTPFGVVAGIVAGLAIAIITYRLSMILPASSVDKPLRLREAWQASKGSTGAILVITILTVLMFGVLLLPGVGLTALHLDLPAEIWDAIVGWLLLMIGVCVLTTLYGHYVEGRPIS